MKIERKWEFIARKCDELDLNTAKTLAIAIDTILLELYGDEDTESWISDYKYNFKRSVFDVADIYDMANTPSYCIACAKEDGCSTCAFGEIYGHCDMHTSLFRKFMDELREDK